MTNPFRRALYMAPDPEGFRRKQMMEPRGSGRVVFDGENYDEVIDLTRGALGFVQCERGRGVIDVSGEICRPGDAVVVDADRNLRVEQGGRE